MTPSRATRPGVREATDVQISRAILRRFAFKCVVFGIWAGLQAHAGFGFCRTYAAMALVSAVLSEFLGLWRRERITAPHWTYFDEAAWFFFIAAAFRMAEP